MEEKKTLADEFLFLNTYVLDYDLKTVFHLTSKL